MIGLLKCRYAGRARNAGGDVPQVVQPDRRQSWAPDGLSVFCHFSHVLLDVFRTLAAGQHVRFSYETPGQDGCDARVLSSARPLLGD